MVRTRPQPYRPAARRPSSASGSSAMGPVLVFGAVATLGLGAIGAMVALVDRKQEPIRHAALLLDISDSMEDGKGSSCTDLGAMADRVMKLSGMTDGSRFQAYMTGRLTGADIVPLGGQIQPGPRLSADQQFLADAFAAQTVEQVGAACRAGVQQVQVTHVFDAVAALAAHMQAAWDCGEGDVKCSIILRSDGIETGRKNIAAALKLQGEALTAAVENLPVIDLKGIDVTICGTASSITGVPAVSKEAVSPVWSHLLPGVTIDPMCG